MHLYHFSSLQPRAQVANLTETPFKFECHHDVLHMNPNDAPLEMMCHSVANLSGSLDGCHSMTLQHSYNHSQLDDKHCLFLVLEFDSHQSNALTMYFAQLMLVYRHGPGSDAEPFCST